MPLVPGILRKLDNVRGRAGRLGLRVFSVTIRLRVWSGERPGVGSFIDYDTPLTNQSNYPGRPPTKFNVRVKQLSARDIVASGGLISDRDYRVGPFTPSYGPGGVDRDIIDPKVFNAPAQVFWIMTGPDLPDSGIVLRRISEEATAMHFYVTLRATGAGP